MIVNQDIIRQDESLLGCPAASIVDQLPDRLSHGVLKWVVEAPEQLAVVDERWSLTFAELSDSIKQVSQHLTDAGVRPGDRVMILAENGVPLMVLFLALSELDAIAAVINPRLSEREIDLIADDCDPRLCIYTVMESDNARSHGERRGAVEVDWGVGTLLVSSARQCEPEVVSASPVEQVLAMIYTTGTTGTPKGVMLTHRNLTFSAFVSGRLRGVQPKDRVYCVLPMSHVFGLSALSSSVLFCGGTVQLVPRFNAEAALHSLRHDGVVGFLGVPTMYALMLEKMADDWQAPKLRFLYSGGSPLDPDLKQRIQSRFGLVLHNGYGLTETGPTICQTRQYMPIETTSVGFVLPGEEIRVQHQETGEPVTQGDIGELWVKGPNVMKGYFRKPDLTAQVLKDGWFNTGDLVRQDEDGSIHIAGRSKELIIRSGFNIYPPEVEAVIAAHPDVSLCAVLGEQDAGDEKVVAFVQPVAGVTLDLDQLRQFARDNLVGYKVPAEFVVMDELPAAPSGKILKHKLRRGG